MQANNPAQTSSYVKPKDETWLLRTPGTWGYIVNKEKLRMKASLPMAKVESASSRIKKPNLMPTTLNEGVRVQHERYLK